jgi:6-phosphogluconolactonase
MGSVTSAGTLRIRAVVGSYSSAVGHAPNAHGAGLTVLDIDLATGVSRILFEDGTIPNPAYLCVDQRSRVVYALSEVWDAPEGLITALRFDRDYESVLKRSELPTGGTSPAYVSIVDGFALVVNYLSGSLATFRLSSDGDLEACVSMLHVQGSGPDPERQRSAHPHCVVQHPSNDRIYVADLGADKLLVLQLDRSTGALTIEHEYKVPSGSGPRHLAFDPSGRLAFVVGELTSRLGVWAVGPTGEMNELQDLPMLPEGTAVASAGADVAVCKDGRRVFASNRGHDSVAVYHAADDGRFSMSQTVPTGATPRSIALTDGDAQLLVANQDGDSIGVHDAREGAGLVKLFDVAIATPTCVKLVDASVFD